MKSHATGYKEIAARYDKISPKVSKIFLLLILPLTAGLLYILFFKQRRFYFDHFILATEYGSLWVSIKFILLPVIMLIGMAIDDRVELFFDDSNRILWLFINILFLFILVVALKQFYKQKWIWTILKAILFLAIFEIVIIQLYHSILFLTVMLFI